MKNQNARSSRVSIKSILTVVLSVLSLMALGTLGWIGTTAWKDHSIASGAKDFDVSANRFIAGLYEVLIERLETNNALQGAEPVSPVVLAKIEASRKIIKDDFDIGLAGIEQSEFPNKTVLLQDLKATLQNANDYRKQADAAIKLPRGQRDENLSKTFVPTITSSVNAGLKVWFAALYSTAKSDPQLARLATIKEIGWRLRDYSGQERSIIASAIASGSAIPAEGWTAITGHRARVAVLWDQLQNLAADSGTSPAIVAAMKGAEQKYFKDFISLSNEMKKVSDAGGKYPVTPAQWVDTTTPQIGSLLDVLYAAAKASETIASDAADRSLRELIVLFGLIAMCAVLAGGSLWMVSKRIIRPMLALSSSMRRLADGDFDVVLPGLDRKDEIGEIAGAVEMFKIKSAEKARAEAQANADRDLKEAAAKAERDRIAAEEKAEADKRAAAERDAATAKVMAEFDAAVGGLAKAAMDGDFTQRVSLEGKEGVVRNLTEAMNTMCNNIGKVMDDLVAMMGAIAEGDLTRRISPDYRGAFGTLKDSANMTAERLGETVADITASAKEVANAAAEISTSTTDLSQRTEEQAAGLEETSASMEEISSTVKKNAENAQQANQLTAGARELADRGGEIVAKAVGAMSRIEDSSSKIADIIGVIDEIARQTNLLALNAAVEAARAGDAGRGFAVVASEVRSLAQRSSQAAKDIKDLITNSSTQVKDGVDLVNKTGSSLNEIVDSIKRVADIVADIASASNEQANGIDQVNKALTQMDEVTQQNSALVEENAATAKTLEIQSAAMSERVAFFRIDQAAQRIVAMPAKPASARPSPAAKRGGPVGCMRSALATALKKDEFEEF